MIENKIAKKVFAEGLIKELKQNLLPECADIECKVIQQHKNNGVIKIGISLRRPGFNVAPILNVDSYYQDVQQGKPLEEIMRSMAEDVQNTMKETNYPRTMELDEYDKVKEFLSVKLINTKANRHMLAELPHREIEDLSLICVLKFPFEDGVGSIKVNHQMIKQWNISEEELCQTALENAQEKEMPVLQRLSTILETAAIGIESDENIFNSQIDKESLLLEPMFVLSNKEKIFGASVTVYPETMNKVSQLFPEGFYIIPSSVNEVMIVPKNDVQNIRHMGRMVREVNRSGVEKSDVLSDRIYEYDKEHGKICQVPESIERKQVIER